MVWGKGLNELLLNSFGARAPRALAGYLGQDREVGISRC